LVENPRVRKPRNGGNMMGKKKGKKSKGTNPK